MAYTKVLVLPVGQGNMSLVQEYNASHKLVYLALHDCGSAGANERPSDDELFKDAIALMKQRADVAKTEFTIKEATHYLDHVIISHLDKDHVNLFSKGSHLLSRFTVPIDASKKDGTTCAFKKIDATLVKKKKSDGIAQGVTCALPDGIFANDDDEDEDDMIQFYHHYGGNFSSETPSPSTCTNAYYMLKGRLEMESALCSDSYSLDILTEFSTPSNFTRNITLQFVHSDNAAQMVYDFLANALPSKGGVNCFDFTLQATYTSFYTANRKYVISANATRDVGTGSYSISAQAQITAGEPLRTVTVSFPIITHEQPDSLGKVLYLIHNVFGNIIDVLRSKDLPTIYAGDLQWIHTTNNTSAEAFKSWVPYFRVISSKEEIVTRLFTENAASSDGRVNAKNEGKLLIGGICVGGSSLSGESDAKGSTKKKHEKIIDALTAHSNHNPIELPAGLTDKLATAKNSSLTFYMGCTPDKFYKTKTDKIFYSSLDSGFPADGYTTLKCEENDRSLLVFYYLPGEAYKIVLPGDAGNYTVIHFFNKLAGELLKKDKPLYDRKSYMTAPHHGSYLTLYMPHLKNLYTSMNADSVIISAGYGNKHGHPHYSYLTNSESLLGVTTQTRHIYTNQNDAKDPNWCLYKTKAKIYSCLQKSDTETTFGYYKLEIVGDEIKETLVKSETAPKAILPEAKAKLSSTSARSWETKHPARGRVFDFVFE